MVDWLCRWHRTWETLTLPAPFPPVLDALLVRYREPQRHYHTLQHLEECFAAFDTLREHAVHPGQIELALWFHDAVYDPRRRDNEALSADLAADALHLAGASEPLVGRIRSMVLATQRHDGGGDPDLDILLDVDLAILGAAPARFAEYERQIRAEYAHVPDEAYRTGRARVLDGFLARPRIYRTAAFFDRYEAQARRNLAGNPADTKGR